MRWIVRSLAVLATIWFVWIVVVIAAQERIVFPGAYLASAQPTAVPAGVEQPEIRSGDGSALRVWYQPGAGRRPDAPGPAVMYFHGNLDTIQDRWAMLAPYQALGISTLAMEYRGYAGVSGKPSQAALLADALVARAWLVQRPEVDSKRLIYHGLSVGGGVAGALAGEHPPAALVLECTFKSLDALARSYAVPTGLMRHSFRTDLVVQQLECPILLLHGRGDWTIPIRHARYLQRISRRATLVEGDFGHDNYHTDWPVLEGFLRRTGFE